jgi:hypothetical protein
VIEQVDGPKRHVASRIIYQIERNLIQNEVDR